jgi:hypothetical protein
VAIEKQFRLPFDKLRMFGSKVFNISIYCSFFCSASEMNNKKKEEYHYEHHSWSTAQVV